MQSGDRNNCSCVHTTRGWKGDRLKLILSDVTIIEGVHLVFSMAITKVILRAKSMNIFAMEK